MGRSVFAFFMNGGTEAYIVRVTREDAVGSKTEYLSALKALEHYRDINILLLPDKSWGDPDSRESLQAAISHCELMRNRMVIIDLPSDTELSSAEAVTDLALPTSAHCAIYYPWPQTSNPLYDAHSNPSAPQLVATPASAFAAGHWARTDHNRHVWKSPAGVTTNLVGMSALSFSVAGRDQDFLNAQGVNALRKLPLLGTVIWGARTLATNADPEYRYLAVKRTAMFIEDSIHRGVQWAAFESNDSDLWSALTLTTTAFMNGLYRAGALAGRKPSEAFFVRCGLGQTMTQSDIIGGLVTIEVGVALVKPAEFIVIREQQELGQR